MQQINLYLPELRPKKEWLTASTLVLCVAGALSLAVVFSILGATNNERLQASVAELENLQKMAQGQVDNMKAMAKPKNLSDLDQRIQTLRRAIADKQKVGRIIEYQNLGNAEGFSSALQALAEHSKPTLTLHRFSLLNGGRYLSLKGQTIQPKDIASYIQQLSDDPVFENTQFGTLTMQQLTKSRRHSFSLGENLTVKVATEDLACRGNGCDEY